MIRIELSTASNGIIKRVIDTQSNQETSQDYTVYKTESESRSESLVGVVELLSDLSDDLGLDLGSDYANLQLNFQFDWGEKYSPTLEEVNIKIKELASIIKDLKEYRKGLIENANNV
jgi:hypothetical protein